MAFPQSYFDLGEGPDNVKNSNDSLFFVQKGLQRTPQPELPFLSSDTTSYLTLDPSCDPHSTLPTPPPPGSAAAAAIAAGMGNINGPVGHVMDPAAAAAAAASFLDYGDGEVPLDSFRGSALHGGSGSGGVKAEPSDGSAVVHRSLGGQHHLGLPQSAAQECPTTPENGFSPGTSPEPFSTANANANAVDMAATNGNTGSTGAYSSYPTTTLLGGSSGAGQSGSSSPLSGLPVPLSPAVDSEIATVPGSPPCGVPGSPPVDRAGSSDTTTSTSTTATTTTTTTTSSSALGGLPAPDSPSPFGFVPSFSPAAEDVAQVPSTSVESSPGLVPDIKPAVTTIQPSLLLGNSAHHGIGGAVNHHNNMNHGNMNHTTTAAGLVAAAAANGSTLAVPQRSATTISPDVLLGSEMLGTNSPDDLVPTGSYSSSRGVSATAEGIPATAEWLNSGTIRVVDASGKNFVLAAAPEAGASPSATGGFPMFGNSPTANANAGNGGGVGIAPAAAYAAASAHYGSANGVSIPLVGGGYGGSPGGYNSSDYAVPSPGGELSSSPPSRDSASSSRATSSEPCTPTRDSASSSGGGGGGSSSSSKKKGGLVTPDSKRKMSHNAVERRRRNMINDNIVTLSGMLPNINEAKPSKAAILKAAISHIQESNETITAYKTGADPAVATYSALKSENERLKAQLEAMRAAVAGRGVKRTLLSTPEDLSSLGAFGGGSGAAASAGGSVGVIPGSYGSVPTGMPEYDNSDFSLTGAEGGVNQGGAKRRRLNDGSSLTPRRTTGVFTDSARLLFAVATLAIFFNPLSLSRAVFGGGAAPGAAGERVLEGAAAAAAANSFSSLATAAVVAVLFAAGKLAAVLAGLMVLFAWDPVTDPDDEYFKAAVAERKRGEACVRKCELVRSEKHFRKALSLLGHGPPTTTLGMYLTLVVQGTRQALHLLWLGEWVDRFVCAQRGCSASFAEAARNYANLQRIYCCCESRKLSTLTSVVTSLNLAGAVGPSPLHAELCSTLAFVLRLYYPRFTRVADLYADRAWHTASSLGVDHQLGWLLATSGYNYMMIGEWERANRALARAARLFDEFGLAHLQRTALAFQGFCHYLHGDLRASAAVFKKLGAAAAADDSNMAFFSAVGVVLTETLPAGDVDGAAAALDAALDAEEDCESRLHLIIHHALAAQVSFLRKDYSEALRLVEEVSVLFADFNSNFVVGIVARFQLATVRMALWEAVESGEFALPSKEESSVDVLSDLLAAAVSADCEYLRSLGVSYPIARPRALRFQGLYLHHVGDNASGLEYIASAGETAAKLDLKYEQASALYDTARLTGDTGASVEQAAALFETMGALSDKNAALKLLPASPV